MSKQTSLTSKQKGFKYQIWLMLIIVFGVIAAGFLLVPKTEQQRQKLIERMGTTNMGQLVKPSVDLSPILASLDVDRKPKWRIVIAGGQSCGEACKDILHNTKQIHMLLGKLTGRVERLYMPDILFLQELDLEQLSQQHPFLQVSAIDTAQLGALLKGSSAEWDLRDGRYFVVTPDHQAVLYYTSSDDPNGLLDDLKHLLKYSPDR